MAVQTLVEEDRKSGMDAFERIKNDPLLLPTAVLWFFDEDASEWKFVVATEMGEKDGYQAAYLRLRSILDDADLSDLLPLNRCVIKRPDDPQIKSLSSRISKTPGGMVIMTGDMNVGIYLMKYQGTEPPRIQH